MKKLLIFLIAFIFSFVVFGCGRDKKDDKKEENNEKLIINKLQYSIIESDEEEIEYETKDLKEGTKVVFETTETEVFKLKDNKVEALKEGQGIVIVYLSSKPDEKIEITINVVMKAKPCVAINNKTEKLGLFEVYELDIDKLNTDSNIIITSSNEEVISVENVFLNCKQTGKTIITVYLEDDSNVKDFFEVEVDINPITIFDKLIIDDVLVKEVTTYGENPKTQKQLVLGSVCRYLFDSVEIIREIAPIDQNEYAGMKATKEILAKAEPMKLVRPGILLEELKYIVYHDTGNAGSGADAKMHAKYMVSSDNRNNRARSWHFTVGDDVIYQHIPTNEVTWQGDSYDAYAKSIGIETCVNYGADLYSVWQNTAKLMSMLIKENDLTIDCIKQHYDMSGKNCPQTLRSNNLYNYAISLIEGELFVSEYLRGYDIEFESLSPEYLDNTGKVIKQPQEGMRLAYKVTFTKGNEKISKVYYSNIIGVDKSKVELSKENVELANKFDEKVISSNLTCEIEFQNQIEMLVNEYHSLSDEVKKLCGTKDYLLNLEYQLFKKFDKNNTLFINEIYINKNKLENILGYNYIELYNNSNEIVDLTGFEIIIKTKDNENTHIIKNGFVYPKSSYIIAFGDLEIDYSKTYDGVFPMPNQASYINLPENDFTVIVKDRDTVIDKFGLNNSIDSESESFKTNNSFESISRKHYIDTDNNSRDYYEANYTPINNNSEGISKEKVYNSLFEFDYKVVLMNRELTVDDELLITELQNIYNDFDNSLKEKSKSKKLLDDLYTELLGIKNPSIKILNEVVSLIPSRIVNDYKLPEVEGVTYSFIDNIGSTYYNIQTGTYLKVSYEVKEVRMVASHGSETMEFTVNFGLASKGDKLIYNTGTVKPSGGRTSDGYGTYEMQNSKIGFGGVAIRVSNNIYFIGKNCLINLNGDNGKTSLTKKELRPLGGENMINNCGIVNGVAKEYAGTGALYHNTGKIDLTFDLSDTYGRNNSGVYGYFKVIFSKNNFGQYYVSNVLPNSGTNDSTNNYIVTLKPGEYLWCPHTYETNVEGGTWLISPSTSTSGGVLVLGNELEIIHYKN